MSVHADAHRVLNTKARSFRWAARLLDPQTRDDTAVLYAFCRLVDDIADEPTTAPAVAHQRLDAIERELSGEAPRPLLAAVRALSARRDLDLDILHELITGVRSDIGGHIVATETDLLRYCYRAAGTVGLMMCRVLDVRDANAIPHAIDLGVAMQLTNIARDVLEDAHNGRVYLPACRLAAEGVSPQQLLCGTALRRPVARVIDGVLTLADEYYASADAGMRYLPSRSRRAIVLASRLYRAIGEKLRHEHRCDPFHGRTVVSTPAKLRWASVAALDYTALKLRDSPPHDARLHAPLRGLPCVASAP